MCRMRCVVVDDEPLAIEIIADYVRRTDSLELAGMYTDPVQALSDIRSLSPDLVFLDIQMPDLNGLELSRMLPEGTNVIFTTAFKEYAFESYEVDAVDYLLKPIRYQKFLEAVSRAEKRASSSAKELVRQDRKSAFFKVDGQFRNITFSEILYVSLNNITTIDGNGNILLGEELIPVSDSYRKVVEEYLSSHMFTSGSGF